MMSIGYTGIAYLDRVPTDVCLARWASGSADLGVNGGMTLARQLPMQVQAIVDRIMEGLENSLGSVAPEHGGVEVSIAGRQGRRNDEAVPMLWRISAEPGNRPNLVRHNPGHRRASTVLFEAVGSADTRAVNELAERVAHREVKTFADADALEVELVQGVRRAAKVSRGVGPNCMSVRLWTEDHPHVIARYWPVDDEVAETSGGQIVPAAYSPWLITPTVIQGPAIHFGGGPGGWSPEGVTFEVHVPPGPVWDGEMLIAGFDVHRRKPPPSR